MRQGIKNSNWVMSGPLLQPTTTRYGCATCDPLKPGSELQLNTLTIKRQTLEYEARNERHRWREPVQQP